MNRIMLGLETLDRSSNAKILSIGYAVFNHHGAFYTNELYPSLDEQGARYINDYTIAWWKQTAPEEYNRLTKIDTRVKAAHVYNELAVRFSEYQIEEVWANNPTFDLSILRHYFEQLGHNAPWQYHQERDFRTLKNWPTFRPMYEEMKESFSVPRDFSPKRITAHNAESDAIFQSYFVYRCLNLDKEITPPGNIKYV